MKMLLDIQLQFQGLLNLRATAKQQLNMFNTQMIS